MAEKSITLETKENNDSNQKPTKVTKIKLDDLLKQDVLPLSYWSTHDDYWDVFADNFETKVQNKQLTFELNSASISAFLKTVRITISEQDPFNPGMDTTMSDMDTIIRLFRKNGESVYFKDHEDALIYAFEVKNRTRNHKERLNIIRKASQATGLSNKQVIALWTRIIKLTNKNKNPALDISKMISPEKDQAKDTEIINLCSLD